MAREVRITIDDDEVFERMKARKGALDLSWEEVLHRGLREVPGERPDDRGAPGESRSPGQHAGPGESAHGPESDHFEQHWRHHSSHARHGRRGAGSDEGEPGGSGGPGGLGGPASPGGPEDSVSELVEGIKAQVHDQVRESLRASMESVEAAGSDLDREMTELERAEDAVLRFDEAVGDDRRYRVPLRVRLETSRAGMDVTVVAVRQGKSVSDTNRFDSESRRAVNVHLASGGTATLSFGGGEDYEVAPALTWSHGDDGAPTVTDVEIEEVVLDG